jgi:hypothetical protein
MNDDAMVEIARLYSLPEALTLQAMLLAADLPCTIGSQQHGMTESLSVALGGYRLRVAGVAYPAASALVRAVLAVPMDVSIDQRRRVLRLLLVVAGTIWLPVLATYILVEQGLSPEMVAIPLSLLTTPTAIQGRGDYWLLPSD